ncbi:MAG TPA: hypothetical protein VD794_03400, partial [Flavisolibacter sp.]|nr:hypothetical protein [Flavisolibacter sp.]
NEQNTNANTTGSNTTTTIDTTTSQVIKSSTMVTTPQSMMIARHRVKDFNKWKASYDAHDSLRLANGMHSYVIGRGESDTNMVLVAVRVDDTAKARKFAKDPSLKQAMQQGGVTGTPTFNFVTLMSQDTGSINTSIRSMVMLDIKAWTPWRTSFESGKQNRMQNGLADRAYGHAWDDTTKAIVVLAVTDSAKARTYWRSDQLKQRRAQGGVIGEPERFVFRVVQRL